MVDIFKKSVNKDSLNIIISHQEKIFLSADTVICIDKGKIVMSGTPSEVLPRLNMIKSCQKLEGV